MKMFLLIPLFLGLFTGSFAFPRINIDPNAVILPENTPKNEKVKATITATDIDGAPVIINANPVKHPFIIIPKGANTWELITTEPPKLDFESVQMYSLQILVKDNRGSSASQTIDIQISDVNEAPFFTGTLRLQDAEVYIAEDTAVGTPIYRVAAKDPDDDALQFSIENISPPGSTGFAIDNNGEMSTTKDFDYDKGTQSYTIKVKVSDGFLFTEGNVKVFLTNVNDNDPILSCTFSSISAGKTITKAETSTSGNRVEIELDEELAIGTAVTTCTATDEDLMNDLTFQLDPGNPYFTVNEDTGTVVIISKMDAEEIGFVTSQSFSVEVCDKDFKCAFIAVTAKILGINDNTPFCDQYLYSFAKPERIPKDTVIATLNCHDPDIPADPLTYQPNSGPIGDGKLFVQVLDTRNVILVTKMLEYDTDPEITYTMMVSVFDKDEPPHTVTTTIIVSVTPVNNFDPIFVDPGTYIFTVPETSGARYKVGKVTATDADKPHCVRYRIINGDMEVIRRFWINPETGDIELMTQPDYEKVKQYILTVEATDCDQVSPRRTVAAVTINIKEENDEAPVCTPPTYMAVVLDNVTAGVNINAFKLNCNDKDSSDTAMRFDIVSGNVNNHFIFDPTHGSPNPKLIVKNPFNYDDGTDLQQKYHLVVHIIDDNLKNEKADRPMTGTVLIDISVIRTNLPAPPPTSFEQKEGLTIVYKNVNTYNSTDWYIPLIFTFMALFIAGLLAWSCHLIWKYTNIKESCQKSRQKVSKKRVKTYQPGTKKEKIDVITEMTRYETVFDGEAVDPVTGQLYEFNSKSGARRWKAAQDNKEENTKVTVTTPASELSVPKPSTPIQPSPPTAVTT